MSSFLTEYQKDNIRNIMDNIHDTFAREITIFKKEKKIFIATDSTYNALYSRIKNQAGSDKVVEVIKMKARVAYAGNFEFLRQNTENEILGINCLSHSTTLSNRSPLY